MNEHPKHAAGSKEPDAWHVVTKCEDIQELLFDYMAGELGPARADLVRDHLRRCPDCQAAAAEFQATFDALRTASKEQSPAPARLSDERRKHIAWALTHPILDWMSRHHFVVSIVIAAIVGTVVMMLLYRFHMPEGHKPEPGVTVTIGQAPPHMDSEAGKTKP